MSSISLGDRVPEARSWRLPPKLLSTRRSPWCCPGWRFNWRRRCWE